MRLSQRLSADVQRRIDELDPARAAEPRARVCKENLNALPLHYDGRAVWALRPDGTLLRVGREATGHPPEPESDPVRIYQALVRAARRYPELCELVPAAQLAMTPRTYPCKSSALTADELRRAVDDGRVLLLEQGPRVMGDSDVYYRVAGREDLDRTGLPTQQGVVFERPVTGSDLSKLADMGFEWAGQAWGYLLYYAEQPTPALPLTSEDRALLERAEAVFDLQLLGLLPEEAAAGAYLDLFERYAADPGAELRAHATACAEAAGLEELDRDVAAGIASALRSLVGDDYASFVDDAERWLRETRRAWRERAEWEVATGGAPSIPALTDDEIPSILRVHRAPSLERRTDALGAALDALRAATPQAAVPQAAPPPSVPLDREPDEPVREPDEPPGPARESRSESPFPVVVKHPRGPNERHLACRICSQLRDEECATEYVHAPGDNTSLPAAAGKLKAAGGAGRKSLQRCPECGTYYLYRHHYEFLLIGSGSYDEYTLTRLTDERAAEYLEGRES